MVETEIIFEVVEQNLHFPDMDGSRTFGIRAYILTSDGPAEEEIVNDITSDRSRIEAFAKWCKQGDIHPKHLLGLVEDEFDLE